MAILAGTLVFIIQRRRAGKKEIVPAIISNVEGPAELKGRELEVERHEKFGHEVSEMDVPPAELEAPQNSK